MGRLPKAEDEDTQLAIQDIFSADAIKVNIVYIDQLKRLFTEFVHQNQMKKSVTWKDIEEKNITMIARSFLKLCRYNHMIPGVFEIERL